MTPQQEIALRNLLAAAEIAAYHYATASVIALPLRAAITQMRESMLSSMTNEEFVETFLSGVKEPVK